MLCIYDPVDPHAQSKPGMLQKHCIYAIPCDKHECLSAISKTEIVLNHLWVLFLLPRKVKSYHKREWHWLKLMEEIISWSDKITTIPMNVNCRDKHQRQLTVMYWIGCNQNLNWVKVLYCLWYHHKRSQCKWTNEILFCWDFWPPEKQHTSLNSSCSPYSLRQWVHPSFREWVTCNGRQLCWI